ncbi:MAG: MBG domain-containing protein [Clostridia bacterium]
MAKLIKYTILSIIFILAIALVSAGLLFTSTDIAYAAPDGVDGTGESNNPFKILSADDWDAVVAYANTSETGGQHFHLMNDIDMQGRTVTPIGTASNPFQGKFHGNSRVVRNLTINTTGMYAGLFGRVGSGGEISDLGVFGGEVNGTGYAGGIAGYNSGQIIRSFSTLNVHTSGDYAGGIAGENNGIIKNSYSTGNINADSSSSYVGGVAGYLSTPIGDSVLFTYSLGKITGGGKVGGVIGGRNAVMPRIIYSYFNRTANPVLVAIGEGLNAYGDAGGNLIVTDNRVDGVQQNNFNNLNSLQFSIPAAGGAWRASYKVGDFSAYFAPNLTSFQEKMPPEAPINQYSYNSVIIRLYDILETGVGEWGTATNPYVISSSQHMVNLSTAVNQNNTSYNNSYFYVSRDIDFAGVSLFNPIGTVSGVAFNGKFDGGNFTFSNLKIDSDNSADNVALFGRTDGGAVVQNLRLDATCSFAGRNGVASISAYNVGSIINVESRAAVRGTAKVGGIVGENRGTLTNILSAVTFTKNPGAQVYGVIGASVNSVLKNVWFFTHYNAECTEVGGAGSMLIVDKNGDISAQKTADGAITFDKHSAVLDYEVDYRTEDEKSMGNNNIYAPDINSQAQLVVYARFVARLAVAADGLAHGDIKLISAVNNTQITEGRYYEGQSVSAVFTINSSYYLEKANGRDVYMNEIANIQDIAYSYDFNASIDGYTVINVSFTVTDNIRSLSALIKDIGAPSIAPRYYDGTPTTYSYTKPGIGEEFSFEYNYGTGGQVPVNASSMQYNLTVSIKHGTVVRGTQSIPFYINPRPLQIPEAALSKIKEYDGMPAGAYVPIAVDQNIIAAHTHSTLGENIVTMDIVQGGTHRVVVKATADFGGSAIGGDKIVDYKLSLEGFSKDNYSIPDIVTFLNGEIIKRTVVYHIEAEKDEGDESLNRRLTRVYDGTMAAISNYGVVYGKGGVSGTPVNPTIGFAVSDGEGGLIPNPAINAGEYVVTISTGNPQYYNIIFDKEYTFSVTPKPVYVTFTDTELTYSTEVQTVGGYYYDINDAKQSLTADYFTYVHADDPEAGEVEFLNAGLYIAKATLRDNYIAIDTLLPNGLKANETYAVINKAEQVAFNIIPLTGNHSYGDAPKELITVGGSGDGEVVFSVAEGFAVIDGNMLIFIGGGTIKVVAEKAESANYLVAQAEYEIDVAKATLQISLEDISAFYGDTLNFNYIFEGYVAGDTGIPNGFVVPSVTIDGEPFLEESFYSVKYGTDGEVIGYTIAIGEDASSDGYDFDYSYFDLHEVKLVINKKIIVIRVDDVVATYGSESDSPLSYKVYELDSSGEEVLLLADDYNLNIELLREEGRNAGVYTIVCGAGNAEENLTALSLANPDYQITFYEGSYEIRSKTLSFVLVGAHEDEATGTRYNKKTFGEQDPELQEGQSYTVSGLAPWDTIADAIVGKGGVSITEGMLRTVGENAYSTIYPDLPYGFYAYLPTGLEVNPNYALSFVGINLRIYPAAPEFEEQSEIAIQYGDKLSTIAVASKVGVNVNGTLEWVQPDLIPDFSESPVLNIDAVFISNDKNYTNASLSLEVSVIAREVTVTFSGSSSLVYNGKEQKQITYTLDNVLEGDELNDELVYYIGNEQVAVVKNAGSYRAVVTINNGNYTVVGTGEISVLIDKAPLLIYLEDISLPETDTPTKNFIYEGFVDGEDASSLTALPNVTFHSEVGNYEITPFGAESPNYQITYGTSMQYVTKTILTSSVASFVLRGNFNSLTEYTLEEIRRAENRGRYSAMEEAFTAFKAKETAYENMKISALYGQSFVVEGEKANLLSTARATMELPARLRESNEFVVVLIKADGSVVEAKNIVREGNLISFDMEDSDYFAIAAPPDYTWVILLSVVGVLFISVFVLDMVSERLGIGRHSTKSRAKRAAKQTKATA